MKALREGVKLIVGVYLNRLGNGGWVKVSHLTKHISFLLNISYEKARATLRWEFERLKEEGVINFDSQRGKSHLYRVVAVSVVGNFYPPLAGRGNQLRRTQWVTRWENAGLSRAQILEKLERDLAPRTAGEELRMIRVMRRANNFDVALQAIQRHWKLEDPEEVLELLRPDLLPEYYKSKAGEMVIRRTTKPPSPPAQLKSTKRRSKKK